MDLIYFFKVILRKKWFIGGLSLLAVLAAFIFLQIKKDVFKSQAQYSTGFTAEKVRLVDGNSGIDIYTADIKFNNAIETFKSPNVINAIGYKLLLHDLVSPPSAYVNLSDKKKASDLYKSVNPDSASRILRETISQNRLLPSNTDKEKDLIEYFKLYGYDYEYIRDHILIERVGRTDYLNITYWSENPRLSALVVNAMGDEFLNYYKTLSSQRTKENAGEIKTMVNEQQRNIDSLGKLLFNEKVKQGSIDPISLSTSAMETVKELESKLAEERSKQNEHINRKKYLLELLDKMQANSVSAGGVSNEEIIALVDKKNNMVAELARKGGNDAALEKQISDLRVEINVKSSAASSRKDNSGKAKEIDNLKTQINEEDALLSAANSTIEDYGLSIKKYTNMANSAPIGSDVTISGIKSRLDLENAMLGTVTEKYFKAEGLAKDDPTTNFIQTAVGQPALAPESKKTLMTMALSGISMFFLSSVIILLLEVFDPRVKTPTLFRRQVKLNVAGVLNTIPLSKTSEQEILMEDYTGEKYSKQVFYKNNVRKLRFELLNSLNKIFLFTSTQTQTGKTTVIESLAVSLLLSKKRVMILDLNFGNNTITQKHNPQVLIQDIGDVLKYNIPLKDQQLLQTTTTSTAGLNVIGCREGNFTPSEALNNIDLERFLKLLKDEFDFILIEGAALNDFADSRELAFYAEEVFTVFSAASNVTPEDNKSIQFIESLGKKNKGAILNNVHLEYINF